MEGGEQFGIGAQMARPVTRWTDVLSVYFRKDLDSDIETEDYWKPQAIDREIWNMLEKDFLNFN